jgi:5-methyltetrahydropteroyltriglutamate--homocysteine methyltransferase
MFALCTDRLACTSVSTPAPRLFPTTVIGSYPQPDWLIDRARLADHGVPRVRVADVWRVAEPYLLQAQDDATLLAIRSLEQAGVDVITDGEMRRESYSNRFATALEGVDPVHPGEVQGTTGRITLVPRVVGPIRRREPVEVRDAQFLRANTRLGTKITLPGPFSLSVQAYDDYYHDPHALALAYADAVNAEVRDLFAAGADVVQIDEPWFRNAPEAARAFGVEVVRRALAGATATTAVHLCFGYAALVGAKSANRYAYLEELADAPVDQVSVEAAQPRLDLAPLGVLARAGKTIVLGVLDLGDASVESPETVAARIRAALEHVPAEQLVIAPDCGMKYLARDVAFAKLQAMVAGAALARASLT